MIKKSLHPRNRNRTGYDFEALAKAVPELNRFLIISKRSHNSLDFSQPEAVRMLNRAILISNYGLRDWHIPEGYLCPPVPGRADYIHLTADLLSRDFAGKIPSGGKVKVMDIGTGANCIYPLIGQVEYGWKFVGTDIDATAVKMAKANVKVNGLEKLIEVRHQTHYASGNPDTPSLFEGVLKPREKFDLTLCNPPFHSSEAEAVAGNKRKWKNLGKRIGKETVKNFGGRANELWCKGGEVAFVQRMIRESARLKDQVLWFSSLVSKESNLPPLLKALERMNPVEKQILNMAQGQKISRILAWTFHSKHQREEWGYSRWTSD